MTLRVSLVIHGGIRGTGNDLRRCL